MKRQTLRSLVIFVSASLLSAGCGGSPPPPADPQQARDAVQTAMEAWKGGATLESMAQRQPAITVIEPNWKAGQRLSDFNITGSTNPAGTDVRFDVELSLQDVSGKTRKQKVTYSVVTDPATVVVREGDF